MKRLCFVSVLMLLAASGASAQQYRTSYFMEGSTMRGYLNPALRPDRGYVYIPVLGTTSVNFNSNALTFKTIFYPVGDNGQLVSLLDDRVTWHDIEPNLKTMNKVGFDLHMTLLGAGFYTGRDFWTIEAGLDVTGGFHLPKSFVEFVKLGSKANAYDMGGLMAGADAVMNISAGYSRRINDELTVGGRVNFKGGLARANMNYDRLNVTLNGEGRGCGREPRPEPERTGCTDRCGRIRRHGQAGCRVVRFEYPRPGGFRPDVRHRCRIRVDGTVQILGGHPEPRLHELE